MLLLLLCDQQINRAFHESLWKRQWRSLLGFPSQTVPCEWFISSTDDLWSSVSQLILSNKPGSGSGSSWARWSVPLPAGTAARQIEPGVFCGMLTCSDPASKRWMNRAPGAPGRRRFCWHRAAEPSLRRWSEDGAEAERGWQAVGVLAPRPCPGFTPVGRVGELSWLLQTQSALSQRGQSKFVCDARLDLQHCDGGAQTAS